MKKTFLFATSVMVIGLIGFACKKSTSTPTSNTTTSTTGSTTAGNNATSSYSVNGVAQSGSLTLIKGPSTSPDIYKFILMGGSGNWTLGAIFSGTLTPVSGQYLLKDSSTVAPGQCFFQLVGSNNTGGVAQAGTLTVTTGATSTISFNNVIVPQPNGTGGTTATYTVSGNIKY